MMKMIKNSCNNGNNGNLQMKELLGKLRAIRLEKEIRASYVGRQLGMSRSQYNAFETRDEMFGAKLGRVQDAFAVLGYELGFVLTEIDGGEKK